MKTEIEKKIEELNKSKVPIVAIDPSLNKYQGKVLFPKKLALAEEKLKGVKLPEIKKHSR
jgi:NAD(P)H-hydrate repair Nnr-like enzyme with NAD(P)H-hydrate epimerase domain